MLTLQLREPSSREILPMDPHASAELTEPFAAGEHSEFEIVLGKRQVASVLFVAIVILVVLSALSYLAGKAASPNKAALPAPPPPPAPLLQATITKADDLPQVAAKPEPEAKSPEPGFAGDIAPIRAVKAAPESGIGT